MDTNGSAAATTSGDITPRQKGTTRLVDLAGELAQKHLLSLGSLSAVARPMIEFAPALHGSAGVLGYALDLEIFFSTCGSVISSFLRVPEREMSIAGKMRSSETLRSRMSSELRADFGGNLDHAGRPLREGEHVAGLRKADASKQKAPKQRGHLVFELGARVIR